MGPSVVLSSAMANKADWEREAGALNSSNEEEEEGDYEQSPHLAHYHGPAVAAFGTPTLLYQHQPTASNQTPYSDQRFHQHLYELDPDQYAACNAATVAASIGAADTTSVYPYIPSPAPMRQEEYLPSSFYAFGAAQKHIKQEAGSDDDDDDDEDDRKPAARQESVTKISPHRKRHSLSKDPFDESPAESVHEPSAVPDQFINPSMSFGDDDDDDDVRNQQGHHFDMPRWSAAADPSVQMGYAAPAPLYAPPLAFTLGDRFPRHSPPPPQLQDSPALHIATPTAFVTRHAAAAQQPQQQQQQQRGRGGPKPRVLLPQPQRKPPPPPPLVHHHCIRREPTAVELAALGTERAKAALVTWYERYNELVAYLAEHGDCNVPQKYPPNPQLGIVRSVYCTGNSNVCVVCVCVWMLNARARTICTVRPPLAPFLLLLTLVCI